jgi:energy-coupling factor transport system permease protein
MLLVFTAGMATAQPDILTGGVVLLVFLYIRTGIPSPTILARMVKRLRWLLLAVFLVYGWWTPGTSVWPAAGVLSPSIEGLYLGMLRVLVLLAIVAAVLLLLQSTSREALLPAVMQLIKPVTTRRLRMCIAVRVLLSLEAVVQVQSLVSDTLREYPLTGRRFTNLPKASRLLYRKVLDRAENADTALIEVDEPTSPPWWQWLFPLAMGSALIAAA